MTLVEKQFARQMQCARAAGIYDAMFLAFGSLLGYVREGGIIAGDHDIDVGIWRHLVTAEQEREYRRLLGEPCDAFPGQHKGLRQFRDEWSYRPDDNRFFWFTFLAGPPGKCRSCCHWFFFEHAGYSWHAKNAHARVKGMPARFVGVGPEITFLGTKIRAPLHGGAMLDWWYPGHWLVPQSSGSSAAKVTMRVQNWKDPRTWRIAA